jgi:hypothetical protein
MVLAAQPEPEFYAHVMWGLARPLDKVGPVSFQRWASCSIVPAPSVRLEANDTVAVRPGALNPQEKLHSKEGFVPASVSP